MKHSIIVKFLAFVLCAMSLVALVFSGFGIAFMQAYDLYRNPLEVIQRDQMNYASSTLAEHYAQLYAAKTLGNAPASLLDNIYNSYYIILNVFNIYFFYFVIHTIKPCYFIYFIGSQAILIIR